MLNDLSQRPRSSSLHPDLQRRLDAVIDGSLAADRIVGAVVLASVDGRVVYRRAAGFADREAGAAMQHDAIFRLASVSKLVVATTAMVLIAQRRLGLDGLVETWLPAFRPRLADGSPAHITIRQLLSHTAGLGYGFLEPEDGPYHRAGVSDGMDRSGLTLDENMRRLASVPLLFEPGSSWCYSLSIDVLGAVIEQTSGRTLPDAVRCWVTEPLGLTDTGFVVTDPARLAAAYADHAPRPRRMSDVDRIPTLPGLAAVAMDPARAHDTSAFPSGGAGMVGTAEDVLRLLETLRQGGAPILPELLTLEMGRDQTGGLPVVGWPGWGHGLGFSVLEDPGAAGTSESPGTWRWGGAYGHSWFVDPAEKLSVVAFTNTALEGMSGGGRFPQDLCRAIYGG
jgi:CubicO group peptidase (beta-lactamase class C family)